MSRMRERTGMAMNYHVIVIVPATMGSAGVSAVYAMLLLGGAPLASMRL